MNYKIKSVLYFASLLLAMVTYYTIGNTDKVQNTELAENTIEQVAAAAALN